MLQRFQRMLLTNCRSLLHSTRLTLTMEHNELHHIAFNHCYTTKAIAAPFFYEPYCCSLRSLSSFASSASDYKRLSSFSLTSTSSSCSLCNSSVMNLSCAVSAVRVAKRNVFSDKVRAGMILCVDKRHYRVVGCSRSQKGQNAASFNIKLVEIGTGRKREVTAGQGHDFDEVKAERVRLLFSGFDDDDQACFVFPEHSHEAGKEVNLKGDSLPDIQQKFLCCGMPVDIIHIVPEGSDDGGGGDGSNSENLESKEIWAEVSIPTSYTYTVEKIMMKGLYKMASLVECDGLIGVNDSTQPGDKIKVILKQDGTAAFGGRVSNERC